MEKTMNTPKMLLCAIVALCIGLGGGWLAKSYLDLRAENTQSLLELSRAHEAMRAGDAQRAILHATQAAVLDPKAYLTFLSLAEFYERIGRTDLALENYDQALRLSRAEGGGINEESRLLEKIQRLRRKADPR
jgi:Tfp pilus assembly protein PilF